jgi:hypothetical protein
MKEYMMRVFVAGALVKWNNAADRSKDEVLSVLHTASRNLVGDLEAVKGDEGALIVQALSRLGAAGTKQEGKLRRSTVVRPSPSKKVVSRVRNIASLILGLFGWYPAGLLVGQSTGNSLLAVGAAVATFAFACVLVVEERYSSETFWQN